MTPDTLVGLLADSGRLRVFAALALGARTDAEAAKATGLSARDTAAARRRLADGGAVVETEDGWAVAVEALRSAARERADRTRAASHDDAPDRRLAPFVAGRSLLSLPAAPGRRRTVLGHVAAAAFDVGQTYDEREVDARLRPWCDGGEVDHVALRRYLVEAGLLLRGNGVYALASPGEPPPAPSAAERSVAALGLS